MKVIQWSSFISCQFTAHLINNPELLGKKIGEESSELIIDFIKKNKKGIVNESADLIYHLLVLWVSVGVNPQDVWDELTNRKLIELNNLLELIGPASTMKKIEEFSKKYKYESQKSIKSLKFIYNQIKNLKNTDVIFDLCSLNSMDYETSFNYTFYVDKLRKPIAFGGRYESYALKDDNMRNATGFSIDLKDVVTVYEK